jgi:16S rRNA G527 N7-methylase RsmG
LNDSKKYFNKVKTLNKSLNLKSIEPKKKMEEKKLKEEFEVIFNKNKSNFIENSNQKLKNN